LGLEENKENPMKIVFRSVVLAVILSSGVVPQSAFGQLALYDDFNSATHLLNSSKWFPFEFIPVSDFRVPLELQRRIDAGKLRLAYRGQGATNSNTGLQSVNQGLSFPFAGFPGVTAMQAQVEVVDFNATNCVANTSNATTARIVLEGRFFNAGATPPTAGNATNDVDARISLVRRATDLPATKVQIEAEVLRCKNAGCSAFSFSKFQNIGSLDCPGRICAPQTLLIEWQAASNRFRFKLNNDTDKFIPYPFPDAQPPSSSYKDVAANLLVEKCMAGPRQAFIEALIDNVMKQ
jgi:hypothetical protein